MQLIGSVTNSAVGLIENGVNVKVGWYSASQGEVSDFCLIDSPSILSRDGNYEPVQPIYSMIRKSCTPVDEISIDLSWFDSSNIIAWLGFSNGTAWFGFNGMRVFGITNGTIWVDPSVNMSSINTTFTGNASTWHAKFIQWQSKVNDDRMIGTLQFSGLDS